jgi:hypothetical protein
MPDRQAQIRELMDAWSALPFEELRDSMEADPDPATASAPIARFGSLMAELLDPDIRFSVDAVEAYEVIWPRGKGHGLGEWLALWRGWFSSWESITVQPGEFLEVEDTVIHEFRAHLVGRGSGVELDIDHFHLWRFDGDLVVEFTIEPTLEAATEAARASR